MPRLCLACNEPLVGRSDMPSLHSNLQDNDIPESIMDMTIDNYTAFLEQRRKLISGKLRKYYEAL
nr:hypothetical protein [Bacteroidota bacterium]